jgi:predicted nucleotidyltransferase component of viral defense system
MIDTVLAKKLASETGIDTLTVVREFIQILYLNELYTLPDLGKTIFKGGTALRLMLGSNRFSEDLDFNTNLDENALNIVTNKALTELKKGVPNAYIKDMKTLAGVSKKIYIPTDLAKQPLSIKLDFSQREDSVTAKQGVIDTKLPISSTVLITYLDPAEILAEKFRALLKRTEGRDLYDIWYLLHKGVGADSTLIQNKFDYYHEKFDLKSLIEKVRNWDDKDLDQDVRKFLPKKDRDVLGKIKELLVQKLSLV